VNQTLPIRLYDASAEQDLAVKAHLLGAFTYAIGPAVLWFRHRESVEVARHCRDAVNFQLTMMLPVLAVLVYLIVDDPRPSWARDLAMFAPLPFAFSTMFFGVSSAWRTSVGKEYRYPLAFALFRSRQKAP
jgi:uncharacterized Tic20 family protein